MSRSVFLFLLPPVFSVFVEIPREDVTKLSKVRFYRQYVLPMRPVILRLESTQNWRAVKHWNDEYINRACPNATLPSFTYTGSKSWGGFSEVNFTTVRALVKSWKDKDQTPAYGYELDIKCACPSLLDDFQLLNQFTKDLIAPNPFDGKAWPSLLFGPQGTKTGIHRSSGNLPFWLTLMTGHKHFRVIAPSSVPLKYEKKFRNMTMPFDIFDEDFVDDYLAHITIFEGEMHPGDTIYIPAGAAQAEQNLQMSTAVAANFYDRDHFHQISSFCHRMTPQEVLDLGMFYFVTCLQNSDVLDDYFIYPREDIKKSRKLKSSVGDDDDDEDEYEYEARDEYTTPALAHLVTEGFCYRLQHQCGPLHPNSIFLSMKCRQQLLHHQEIGANLSATRSAYYLNRAVKMAKNPHLKTFEQLRFKMEHISAQHTLVNVKLKNTHPQKFVYVYWLDPLQREVPVATIQPASEIIHRTFPDYTYFLREGPNITNKTLLQKLVIKAHSEQNYTVGPKWSSSSANSNKAHEIEL